jgi:hypothetical protein
MLMVAGSVAGFHVTFVAVPSHACGIAISFKIISHGIARFQTMFLYADTRHRHYLHIPILISPTWKRRYCDKAWNGQVGSA